MAARQIISSNAKKLDNKPLERLRRKVRLRFSSFVIAQLGRSVTGDDSMAEATRLVRDNTYEEMGSAYQCLQVSTFDTAI